MLKLVKNRIGLATSNVGTLTKVHRVGQCNEKNEIVYLDINASERGYN